MRMFLPITNRKPVMAAGKYSHKKSRFCLIQKNWTKVLHEKDSESRPAMRTGNFAFFLQYLHNQCGRRYGHAQAKDQRRSPRGIGEEQAITGDREYCEQDLEGTEPEDLSP